LRQDNKLLEQTVARLIIFCFVLLGLAACEATKGAGRDLEKFGSTITKTAQDVQKSL
jgi:entericidin B